MRRNKRGAVWDLFMLMILLLFGSIMLMVTFSVWNSVAPEIEEKLNDSTVNATYDNIERITNNLDNIALAGFIILIILMIVLAFAVDFHPIFFFLFMLIWIIGVIVAVPISNTYETVAANPHLAAAAASMPMQHWIMTNLPFIIGLVGAVMIVVMFSKSRITGGGVQ